MKGHLVLAFALCAFALNGRAAGARRALVIGINDYTASGIPVRAAAAPGRDWPDLRGAVNDATLFADMLVLLYGYDRRDIVTLTDQNATRAAILQAIEQHLVKPSGRDDTVFFYYAGHGSQVVNSLSDEPDRLDESLVPADSRRGALDIRDKELRLLFNRILDCGARLTVILDNCHSGSGARGLPSGAISRRVRPDPRDVKDGTSSGPRPEDRGALVVTSAPDFGIARETQAADGSMHGAFTWAWVQALGDAPPDEPAAETFLRAEARLRGDKPFQTPVLAGTEEARQRSFLGTRIDGRGNRTVIAVRNMHRDGTVLLHGGWAHGLAPGTQLRLGQTRLTITAVLGLAQSEARVIRGTAPAPGALLEVTRWSAASGRPLRLWVPRADGDLTKLARKLRAATRARWISDPTEVTPSYLVRQTERRLPAGRSAGFQPARIASTWELLHPTGRVERFPDHRPLFAAVAKLPSRTSLFVQFPAPAELHDLQTADSPENADYILTSRLHHGRLEYAWVRPDAGRADRLKNGLPLRTAWTRHSMRDALLQLERIHGWQQLESPPAGRAPYRLLLRRQDGGAHITGRTITGGTTYEIVLRTDRPLPAEVPPRYYYAFTIDSHGRSYLAFPRSGSVENRFPLAAPAPPEIVLGRRSAFDVLPPYGVDTWFLLSTDEPLPDPWILQWEAVRAPRTLPSTWSIEKLVFESVPPR